jgi:methylmalonyl-CoA epimerase
MKPLVEGLHHVAVVVGDLERALDFYAGTLGMEVALRETIEAEGIHVAFVRAGATLIELLEPFDPDCAAARRLKRFGSGVAHICLATPDIDALQRRLHEQELLVIGDGVRTGAAGRRVLFLHPKESAGLLTEFAQAEPDEDVPYAGQTERKG